MIELPPGWIPAYRAATDKAQFLRGWADQIYARATWTTDPERLADLVEALGGVLGTALTARGTPPPGPRHGDILRTYSGRLWPDPDNGPWLVLLAWQIQNGKLQPVAVEIASAAGSVSGTGRDIAQHLDAIGTPLTAGILRTLPLGRIIVEDRAEITEAAEALKARATG